METFGKMFLVFVCGNVYDRCVTKRERSSGENRKGAFRNRKGRKVQSDKRNGYTTTS